MKQSRRPEPEFLLCCARTHLDPTSAARLGALLHEPLDWNALLWTAYRHGLAPLLYWHLIRVFPDAVPHEILARLREQFDENARRNLFLTGELLSLLRLLDAHGITAIPWKGPTLAAGAYSNLALRQFCDLDIIVRRKDVQKASELLLSRGYCRQFRFTAKQEAAFLDSHCERAFVNHHNGVMVDLHWAITPHWFSFRFDIDRLWERLAPMPLAGATVLSIVPEELLLTLCVHGSKHCWERLSWLCDISELIRATPDLDWDRLRALARASGSERMLLLGLGLAHDLLDTDIPASLNARTKPDGQLAVLKRRCSSWLSPGSNIFPGFWGTIRFHLRAKERLSDRIRYCVGTVVTPSAADWLSLPLPDCLFPFYYLYRPLRLAFKHARLAF